MDNKDKAMIHLKTLDTRKDQSFIPQINRVAVRAVVYVDGKLLLVHIDSTNEYKFPGGGVELGEDKETALIRETLEETGRTISKIDSPLGYVDQINIDIKDSSKFFYMRSYYYLCEIDSTIARQNLSGYEAELEFSPVWMNLQKAVDANENRMLLGSKFPWTIRELFVLKYLKEVLK